MSEIIKESIVQVQAKSKPKIGEIIPEYLEGKVKQSLEELLEFCRINGIKYPWSATNIWKLQLKVKTVGMIYVGKYPCQGKNVTKGSWYAHINTEPLVDEFIIKENLTEVIHRNVIPCVHGVKSCGAGKTMTIFGKEFHGVHGVLFKNPDAESLDCIKKLLEYRKESEKVNN
jgi:hypothetical protein